MGLNGQVVAVTGASAGIGRATVRELARRGADVGLIARGQERLDAARAEVEGLGRRACVAPADVAQAEQLERRSILRDARTT
jgi:short-subunit dehydrogenase